MFYSITGFIASLVIVLYITLTYALVCFDTLGKYNIGGVPNSIWNRIGVLIVGFIVGFLWYRLIQSSPFHISITI